MKIRTKITIPFLLATLIIITSGFYIFYSLSTNTLKLEINRHLDTATVSKARHIVSFLEEQKEKVEMIATSNIIEEALKLEEIPESLYSKLNEELTHILEINKKEYYDITILDENGKVVATTNFGEDIGRDFSEDISFMGGKEQTYIRDAFYDEEFRKDAFSVSAPVFSHEFNDFIGLVIIKIDMVRFNDLLSDPVTRSETGETYLVNKDFYMISPSRFLGEVFLRQKADTDNARDCFALREAVEDQEFIKKDFAGEIVELSKDYRGVSVVGSYVYIPETDWCLLAEYNEAEILAPVKRILWLFFIGAIISIIALFIVAYLVSRTINKPISALREGILTIEQGNLDYRVGTDSKDEIGELSRAFDKMTKSIVESRSDVEGKVQEQTREIISTQRKLEDQQKAILNILEDVEEEKEKTEKEKDKINTILYSIGDGVFVVDKKFKITMINKVAADICDCFRENAIGKLYTDVFEFIDERTKKKNDKFIRDAISTGEVQTMANHTLLVRKDGIKIPVSDSSAPLKDKDGNIIGCVVVFRDVTEEREIDKMKTEFVSIASHQLRTPLTSISWFAEMLLGEDVGKLNKKQKEYLSQVYNSNKRMIKLVNDLLNVSRIETGKMIISPKLTQMEDLIKDIINEVQVLAKSEKVSITFKEPKVKLDKIEVDVNLIRQVIQNLLTNAIRYNKKEGEVIVKAEIVDKNFLISVADTGIGIPRADQKKMFTKFFRSDNAIKKQADGNGLGLYVNQAIVEISGGKIWFESEEGKGTTFYVSIPVSGMQKKKGTKELVS